MGFCGFGMANSESGYRNLPSSGLVPKSLGCVVPVLVSGNTDLYHV